MKGFFKSLGAQWNKSMTKNVLMTKAYPHRMSALRHIFENPKFIQVHSAGYIYFHFETCLLDIS